MNTRNHRNLARPADTCDKLYHWQMYKLRTLLVGFASNLLLLSPSMLFASFFRTWFLEHGVSYRKWFEVNFYRFRLFLLLILLNTPLAAMFKRFTWAHQEVGWRGSTACIWDFFFGFLVPYLFSCEFCQIYNQCGFFIRSLNPEEWVGTRILTT